MRIIAVANQKGGCGKTTTSVNLAACLATNNRRVLLIDLDPQSHATLGLNIKSDVSMYNVLSKLTNNRVRLQDIVKNVSPNFDIAPSSIVLSTLEQEFAGEISRESRLWDVMNSFEVAYDYILIDCPPNLGILTINAIRASHEIIVPVEASRFSLEGLSQLIDIINLVRDRLNHKVDYRVLVTNFDSRLRHSFNVLAKIKTDYKDKIYGTMVHVNVKLKEAQSFGSHILNYDKYCRGAKDYFSLSREIITEENAPSSVMPVLEKKMAQVLKKELPKLNATTFSITAPEAKEVYLAADFNDWKVDESSRMEISNGVWMKKTKLNPGTYRYRFVIDGKWTIDPSNPLAEANPFGEADSLVEVKSK